MPPIALLKPRILIVEEVQETRDSIRELLRRDGYHVDLARDEDDAVDRASQRPPDLILISLGGSARALVSMAQRIRSLSGLKCEIPAVIFSLSTIPQGEELELEGNIHLTVPDNFDQLRKLLKRLSRHGSQIH
jgi:DNA-binding response OmpR family regulator